MSEMAVLVALYIGGFVLQIYGVVLIVLEIASDVRAAKAIRERADAPDPPNRIVSERGGVTMQVGGLLGATVAQTAHSVDSFREFTAERLSGGLRQRVLGVVLFVAGAVVALVANLIATI